MNLNREQLERAITVVINTGSMLELEKDAETERVVEALAASPMLASLMARLLLETIRNHTTPLSSLYTAFRTGFLTGRNYDLVVAADEN